ALVMRAAGPKMTRSSLQGRDLRGSRFAMVSPPLREDTRRRGSAALDTSLPRLSHRDHISRLLREGTLGCPPRLPDLRGQVTPDVGHDMRVEVMPHKSLSAEH